MKADPMAHHTIKNGYDQLVTRLNRAPQGAPPSVLLNRILAMLMNEKEAGLLGLLPIRPFTAERAARTWKMPVREARLILDQLAGRALLVDIEEGAALLDAFMASDAERREVELLDRWVELEGGWDEDEALL